MKEERGCLAGKRKGGGKGLVGRIEEGREGLERQLISAIKGTYSRESNPN